MRQGLLFSTDVMSAIVHPVPRTYTRTIITPIIDHAVFYRGWNGTGRERGSAVKIRQSNYYTPSRLNNIAAGDGGPL